MLCHLATCASASIVVSLASSSDISPQKSGEYPSFEVGWIGDACERKHQGAYHAVRCVKIYMGYPTGYQDLVRCALVRVGAYRRRIVASGAEDRSRVWLRELVIDSDVVVALGRSRS